jgi:hypothetical protein
MYDGVGGMFVGQVIQRLHLSFVRDCNSEESRPWDWDLAKGKSVVYWRRKTARMGDLVSLVPLTVAMSAQTVLQRLSLSVLDGCLSLAVGSLG